MYKNPKKNPSTWVPMNKIIYLINWVYLSIQGWIHIKNSQMSSTIIIDFCRVINFSSEMDAEKAFYKNLFHFLLNINYIELDIIVSSAFWQ